MHSLLSDSKRQLAKYISVILEQERTDLSIHGLSSRTPTLWLVYIASMMH